MRKDKERQAREVKRAKTFRQIRAGLARAKLWKERWAKHPETMRANLDRINGTRKANAEKRTEHLKRLTAVMPDTVQAGDIRKVILDGLVTLSVANPISRVEPVLSALRRRGLVRFDLASLKWFVAK